MKHSYKRSKTWGLASLLVLAIAALGSFVLYKEQPRVLVFSKTTVFRHASIGAGKLALIKMGQEHGFAVDTTEDATKFNEENLKKYKAVLFLSTTGDVLNAEQQNSFERYIQAGGGYLGIHAATDTEYDWPWYGKLAGAWFSNHPMPDNVQKGTFVVVDKNNPATSFLPERWDREDEFYSFKNISPDIHVLLKIDEKTYKGGTNGEDHPMAWYQEFDGGRSFYTAGGHTDASFSEPLFLKHVWEGLNYVMGGESPKSLDYSKVTTKKMPEENRFTKVVIEEKLEEPMELTVLPDNRVLFIERRGNVKLYNPATGKIKVIAKISVSTKYVDASGKESEAEDGLLGLTKDPNFSENNWIYLYYSPVGKEAKNILTRYELKGDELVLNSKKVLLEVNTQREQCCHTGGSIAFDGQRNLFLSTGDNTNPHGSDGYSPTDEREGRSPWDAQKSSANTNDLRGKILRIHPENDGSYTIPEGNLFAKGTAKTRPEIYTMGHRNPFRISVDPKTGYLYWGDVGPDASKPKEDRGPAGHDEIGQAKAAGNFGWPYFVGDNKAYNKFDFKKNQSGAKFNAEHPVNTSPNNTGLNELPAAQNAFIWYPYAESPEFPLVGTGGRSAMAGPVFHSDEFKNAKRAFPDYYDGKLFIYEWMRGWIMAVTLDKDGNYAGMEHFMQGNKYSNPMDMEFGPDGDLYMLEYGSGWFQGNDDARLVRIEYNGGNRKPEIVATSDKTAGALPLTVNLSAKGTTDPDNDALKYEWKITSAGRSPKIYSQENSRVTFDKPGIYKAVLTVTDGPGAKTSKTIEIKAGNEPAVLAFDITPGNKTFFFPNKPINYNVKVKDKEDGSLANGKILPAQVAVTADYLPEGFDQVAIAQGHRSADASAQFAEGSALIAASDCKACHNIDKKSVGPTFRQVAFKYKNNSTAPERLAKKIISGGSGVWGEVSMSAHPKITQADATKMVKYILNLSNKPAANKSLPVKGTIMAKLPEGDKGNGIYLLRAAYKDKGALGIPGITAEKTFTLRNARISASSFDASNSVQVYKVPQMGNMVIGSSNGAYIGFNKIDLTGISELTFTALAPKEQANAAGGTVEMRIDSPTGKIVGESTSINPVEMAKMFSQPPTTLKLAPTSGVHDIYFIYKNPKAATGQIVFVLTDILFKMNEADKATAVSKASGK
ncbi:ThuA domain-containing protein [Rubrolithibacter danxiaensis]|uniref:ThuA domain-containing protein n=1 Tax=Rubrolithibacter danxiaensis TaxID=3390805 RepID=UPI003BF7BFEC